MPLFVKKKKLKINIFHLNTVTKQQLSCTHTPLVHLFIINSSISLYYSTSKIVNIFASLSIHSFHIHKSDQFVNCY